MDYSNFPPYVPPFYSTNYPYTTSSPNMTFNHGYTPPSLTSSSSSTTTPLHHQQTSASHTPLHHHQPQIIHTSFGHCNGFSNPPSIPYINNHITPANTYPSSFNPYYSHSYTPLSQQPHKISISLVPENDFSNPPSTLTPSYYTSPSLIPPNFTHQSYPTVTTLPTPSPSPNSTTKTPQAATIPNVEIRQKISIFDGSEDSYWWVLCAEKFFKEQRTPTALKLPTAVLTLKGRAHRWWLWRSRRQPPITTWEAFTNVFLWRFKPEWREILPVDNEEEEEPDLELSLSNGSSSHVTESTTTMEEELVVDASFTPLPTNPTTTLNLVPLLVKPSTHGDGETVETQESITDVFIVDEKGFAVTTKLVETEINERDKPHEIIVDVDGDFTFLSVDSILQIDKDEKKFVLDHVAISDTTDDFVEEQKRHVAELLKNSTTTPSMEKKVVLTVDVAETTQQHPFFIFQLSDFPIDIFDPGGMLTVVVYPDVRHCSQIKKSFTLFSHGFQLPNHLKSVSDRHNFFSGSVKVVPFSSGPASTFPWVPWSHKCNVTNRDINVFNPDSDEHRILSPTIYGNYCTTLLLVPWDRGKIESCNILFPATVLFPVRGAICGWPWVPWFHKHSVTNGGFDVFDPGGNKCVYHSSAMIDGDNRHTLSLLWLPWDRGKFTVEWSETVIWALFVWISVEVPLSSIWFD